MLNFKELRPLQAMVAALFFKRKRLLLALPRQEGKTEIGVRLLEDLTSRPFTSSALFLAKDKKSGKKATREKFMRIFDKSLFSVNTENVYLKSCPTSAIFMDSVDKDPDRIRGGTYSMIHWSEVAFSKIEKGESIISVFDKVIQPTLRNTDGYVLLESTNNGKNGWFDLWHNAKEYGFATFKLGLSDLVYMGLCTPEEYDKIQSTTHPDVFKQEYECEWLSFQGKVYPEFSETKHVRECAPPDTSYMTVLIAIDWGYRPSATGILFAYVKDTVLYIFDEHYATEELAAITADNIQGKLEQYLVPRAMTAAVADHEEDRIAELHRRNIPCSKASKANVLGARIQIKEMFYFNRIVIDPKCKYLLRDLNSATWDEKKEGEIDYAACNYGHYDQEAALRYLVRELSDFERPEPIRNPHKDSGSAAAFDLELRRNLDGTYTG